jgi:hypothetical protein
LCRSKNKPKKILTQQQQRATVTSPNENNGDREMIVIAENVPDDCSYLTAGKKYKAQPHSEKLLRIEDDEREFLEIRPEGCAHLEGGTWTVSED